MGATACPCAKSDTQRRPPPDRPRQVGDTTGLGALVSLAEAVHAGGLAPLLVGAPPALRRALRAPAARLRLPAAELYPDMPALLRRQAGDAPPAAQQQQQQPDAQARPAPAPALAGGARSRSRGTQTAAAAADGAQQRRPARSAVRAASGSGGGFPLAQHTM